jgi:hypothetical protein
MSVGGTPAIVVLVERSAVRGASLSQKPQLHAWIGNHALGTLAVAGNDIEVKIDSVEFPNDLPFLGIQGPIDAAVVIGNDGPHMEHVFLFKPGKDGLDFWNRVADSKSHGISKTRGYHRIHLVCLARLVGTGESAAPPVATGKLPALFDSENAAVVGAPSGLRFKD